ncbi:MAG: NAD(P)-dependent oxidoreductase [Candidatus Liptonbacteria bacterium]|nr:NAD(P)-dependent oxidoreductase [Candidatus Liptonbacteria bacterium]
MSKILVTGGAGYIGSMLVPELLRRGHIVTVIDNFMYGQTSLADCAYDEKLTVVRGDARSEDLVAKYIADKDYIIPLACIVGMPACNRDPVAATTTNLDAIRMILEFRKPEQRIIFPNTNSGYGVGSKAVFCDENSFLNPISLYGRLKVEAEKAILESGNAITLRLATVFGMSHRMRLDLLVNDFVHRAMKDGSIVLFESHFKRNFIHIRDVVRGFIHCMENFDRMKNQAYNLGLSDANLSKVELCEEIKKFVPNFVYLEAEIGEDPDKRNYIVSNAKIEATGFKPAHSLQSGIKELVKGYQIIRHTEHTNFA